MSDARPLVCFALKEEAKPFMRTAASLRVRILITGMGKKNAERVIRAALTGSRPGMVLTCGFAGGLNPTQVTGEVLFQITDAPITSSLSSLGGERVSARTSEGLHTKLLAAGAHEGKFHCAEHVLVTAEKKGALWRATGADAVEMESQVIREICREQKIPGATVRVILDPAGESLPLDFNSLMTPDLKLDSGKLALAILKSPGKISALLRLQKQTSAAAEKLAQVLEAVV